MSGEGDSTQKMLTSLSGKYDPVILEMDKNFEEVLPEVRKSLSDVFASHNILEPFERTRIATEHVHAQKVGEN